MLKWINKKRNKKGFTLVELVVVIAILGILAVIAVPKLGSSQKGAKIAAHNANVRILKSVATMYLSENPDTIDEDIKKDSLTSYIDGEKYPEVPKGLENLKDSSGEENEIKGDYTVKVDDKGNIVVIPGEVKGKETN